MLTSSPIWSVKPRGVHLQILVTLDIAPFWWNRHKNWAMKLGFLHAKTLCIKEHFTRSISPSFVYTSWQVQGLLLTATKTKVRPRFHCNCFASISLLQSTNVIIQMILRNKVPFQKQAHYKHIGHMHMLGHVHQPEYKWNQICTLYFGWSEAISSYISSNFVCLWIGAAEDNCISYMAL